MSHWLILALAGAAAGVINAIAGGGSLVSFPALLFVGVPPVTANATNTLAIWPGAAASVWAYRDYIEEERPRAWVLAWPCLLGGLAGSVVLLHTPESAFRAVVPWLILFACALLAVQTPVARWLAARGEPSTAGRVPVSLWLVQLAISFYGGYFGAGIGILMLAAMGLVLRGSLQHANALKVLFATLINGVAVIYFLWARAASLPEAALMAATSLVGGYVGARLAQKLPARLMRGLVVTYGVGLAVHLFRTL